MGYANPIERMGQAEFARRAEAAGVDGVLVVDYPPEEVVEFAETLGRHGIAPIFLLAPTSTEDRIQAVAKVEMCIRDRACRRPGRIAGRACARTRGSPR